jgi:hypothetical protein
MKAIIIARYTIPNTYAFLSGDYTVFLKWEDKKSKGCVLSNIKLSKGSIDQEEVEVSELLKILKIHKEPERLLQVIG